MLYLYDISSRASPGRIKTSRMLEKIKKNPRFKHFLIGLISSHKNPRPRLWVRWFVNPFVHKKGRGAVVRSRRSRHDLFPWHRFEVGRGALVEQFTVLNNGAGDILIGAGARVGIGSVVIGPVRMGERAGLGQHVFVAGFNHGYADATRDSNVQPLVVREVVIGRESHIGANSVVVAGVHIGERVQVGAGSVVTKDIPSYCVAAGNPARIIKRYDFRRRRWVRTDDGTAPAGSSGRNDSRRNDDTGRRKGHPAAAADAQPDRNAKSDRQEAAEGRNARNQPKGDAPRNDAPDRRRQQNDRAAADRERDVQKQAGNRGKTAAERLPATSAPAQEPRATATERPEGSPRREQATGRPANERPAQGQHAADQSAPGQPAQGIAQEETPTTARRRRNRRKPAPDNPGSRETGADMQAASGIGQEPTPNTAAEPHRNGQKATPNEPQGRSADTTAQIRSAAPQPDNRDKASADRNSATAPEPGTASQERPASRTTEPTAESPANDRPAQGQSPQAAPSADASSAAGSPDNR